MNEKLALLRKSAQLKQTLTAPDLSFVCEVHDGIAEAAGLTVFKFVRIAPKIAFAYALHALCGRDESGFRGIIAGHIPKGGLKAFFQ